MSDLESDPEKTFYIRTLSKFLAGEKAQILFPNLNLDAKEIVELECYRALHEIKAIIMRDPEHETGSSILQKIIYLLNTLGVE